MRVRRESADIDRDEILLSRIIDIAKNQAVMLVKIEALESHSAQINGKVAAHESWINARQAQLVLLWGAIVTSGLLGAILMWIGVHVKLVP